MGKPLIKVQVGILLIMGGRSVEKVCTFSINFQQFICPSIPYQHRKVTLQTTKKLADLIRTGNALHLRDKEQL